MKLLVYIKKARHLVLWGAIVGLVLGVGVWLVVLNDLGARLATVGAFIAAILTPLIAFIVNSATSKSDKGQDRFNDDDLPRNSKIIIIAALVAFIVAVGVVWATPRVVRSVENYFYYSYDTQEVDVAAIVAKNNLTMQDSDIADFTFPATKHRELKVRFTFKNQASTTLCANAATLKIDGPTGSVNTLRTDQEQRIDLGEASGDKRLVAQLIFLPETDPSCRLDVNVTAAVYSH
jgi:hypothetical protein